MNRNIYHSNNGSKSGATSSREGSRSSPALGPVNGALRVRVVGVGLVRVLVVAVLVRILVARVNNLREVVVILLGLRVGAELSGLALLLGAGSARVRSAGHLSRTISCFGSVMASCEHRGEYNKAGEARESNSRSYRLLRNEQPEEKSVTATGLWRSRNGNLLEFSMHPDSRETEAFQSHGCLFPPKKFKSTFLTFRERCFARNGTCLPFPSPRPARRPASQH
jgi:hypothetical protein